MTMFTPATFVFEQPSGVVFEYELSPTDLHWLAVSLWGECSAKDDQACGAVAWTMMARWMRWGRRHWDTFTGLMRAFSQPINPKWLGKGTAEEIERRKMYQGWTWGEIPPRAREYAIAFAEGRLGNPVPGAVDFAEEGVVRRQGKIGTTIAGNTFLQEDQQDFAYWPGIVYRIEADPGASGVDVDDDDDGQGGDNDRDPDGEITMDDNKETLWGRVLPLVIASLLVSAILKFVR